MVPGVAEVTGGERCEFLQEMPEFLSRTGTGSVAAALFIGHASKGETAITGP